MRGFLLVITVFILIFAFPLFATGDLDNQHSNHPVSDGHEVQSIPHMDGTELTLPWVIPFAGILLSIAIFPLVAPRIWHHHFGKISAFWALVLLILMLMKFGIGVTGFELLHVSLLEYFPFIILLLTLFTIAGGVRLTGSLRGSPPVNLGILLLGTILASWMGTTGAAMLLIRPLIRANKWRQKKVHVVIFFIFLVANIGGSLTPLGDPPLFLGFLKGLDPSGDGCQQKYMLQEN
ncbi:MAG: sodium:proton antiporter [Candidatus Marinimicrobia bacterium]|nr:sodium:proton antiporter [Candidatus Neomarinimicrobiota bacterium]